MGAVSVAPTTTIKENTMAAAKKKPAKKKAEPAAATGATVAISVTVRNPDTGEIRRFSSGDTMPEEWAALVSNPAVFK